MDTLVSLVECGKAYIVDGYVILDSRSVVGEWPTPRPIQYPILLCMVKSDTDYPLWSPCKDGIASPFGNGYFTVNMAYLKACGII